MSSSVSGTLLKYLGIAGHSSTATGHLVPRAKLPDAQERIDTDFMEGGRISDPDLWARYSTVLRRPVTYESMLLMWEEMSNWDLVAAALVEVVDEATQLDSHSPATLWYECNDQDFEDELNQTLLRVGAEDILPSQVWYLAGLGNHFEKLDYEPHEGVLGMSFVHPIDIRRYWLERNRQCIGYRWSKHRPNKEDVFVDPDNNKIEHVAIDMDSNMEDLYYPWDFLHFRRLFRLRNQEHGEPLFDEAQGIYKKLRIAIDQMVVMRAQIQPDRYQVLIDVKDQPPTEQFKTVQRWKQRLRSKLAFGRGGGTPDEVADPTDFKSFYNSMSLDTILWMPKPTGFEHAITKIPGTANIPDVYDIEMLTNLFFSILGMPKSWLGLGGGGAGGENAPVSGKALLASDMRFLRKIKSIRRPLVQGWTWLGYFHAILKGKNPSELEIRAKMPPIGSLEDQLKLELVDVQADILTKMGDVMKTYNLPREAWIELIFKRYMHLPDEMVNTFLTSLPPEVGVRESTGKPVKSMTNLLQEIREKMEGSRDNKKLIHEARELLRKDSFDEDKKFRKVYKNANEVLSMPNKFKANDLIISSFGNNPTHASPVRIPGKSSTTISPGIRIEESKKEPAWRKYIKPGSK